MNKNFQIYTEEADKDIQKIREHVTQKKREPHSLLLSDYYFFRFKKQLLEVLGGLVGVEECLEGLNQPPAHIAGDFALPVFPLAKERGESPAKVAEGVAHLLNTQATNDDVLWASAVVVGPFVNIILKDQFLIESVLGQIRDLSGRYGENNGNENKIESERKVVLVEYSSVNVAKPIGVGHMRSTIIGQAIANIFEYSGAVVIRHNYLGDWGTQFGKLAYAYELWGDEEMLKKDPLRSLKNLYVKFHEEAEKDPALEDKGREYAARLEADDEELLKVWSKFKDISLEGFKKTYERLGVSFDTYLVGEAYFAHSDEKDRVIGQCLAQTDICHVDEESGAVVVEGLHGRGSDSHKELPAFILRKKDGTSLYLTRDVVALKERIRFWNPDQIFIVVGSEQELHFRQLFSLAERLHILDEKKVATHISFGTVLSDGKKMSTRKGSLVELEGLLEESVQKSATILKEKNPDLSEAEIKQNAEIIGIGAVVYNDLRQSRERNISFDWNRMLDFEGGSAAYLQYTCVRIASILSKVGVGEVAVFPLEPTERSLLLKLSEFPKIIHQVQASGDPHPHLIATYLEELAQLFNSFYGSTSVKGTQDEAQRKMRIQLIGSVRQVLVNGLNLLNIRVPQRM